jgi:hypothetical protein
VEILSDWWRTWVSGPPDRWVSLSLFVCLILLAPPGERQAQVMLHMIVLTVLLALSFRWRIAPVALLAMLAAGIDLRLAFVNTTYSDVGVVTRAAIERFLAGGNPYGVGYSVSTPPGSPFVYGPLVLLWYLPWPHPGRFDMLISMAILAALVARGHLLGTAIYATSPILLTLASDGSNDTSAGLLILLALVVMGRAPRMGAFLLGFAIAFKPYALAWAPALLAWAGLSAAIPLLASAAILWLPALIVWGPSAIAYSFVLSQRIGVAPWYSLGQALTRFGNPVPREVLDVLRYFIGAVTAGSVALTVRSSRGVIVGGILVFLATLYTGYWSTFGYFSAIAPVICWHLDDWLGFAGRRVEWPTDPVGRLTEAFDRRFAAAR